MTWLISSVLPIDMLWLWVARVLNNVAPTQLIRLIVSEVHVAPNQELPYQAPLICSNGGRALVIGCIQSQQCLPFTKESVACLQGICCTVPQKCPNDERIVGLQYTNSQSCVSLSGGKCPVMECVAQCPRFVDEINMYSRFLLLHLALVLSQILSNLLIICISLLITYRQTFPTVNVSYCKVE
ncbi:Conserved hypothetical protein, putative [Brugia malayi]|uniref:Uncharacterized protein n=1 Tax=Brugia malayi TaxID=6279 RepID=A0A4E9FB68_BRUMA|nr:Conserved hypothetical protein, putative [Brugia malayi]VIO90919.1 Conserved hypothetical protein, putative [Brugia malayi]